MTSIKTDLCVVGHNIGHSRSPLIHGYWIKKFGLNARYGICDIDQVKLPELIEAIRVGEKHGCNVTVPYKQQVIQFLDHLDPAAVATGSVNTIYVKQGQVRGTSTDGSGFLYHLQQTHSNFKVDMSSVLVFGAGGAARSIIVALADAGCSQIFIANRTLDKAHDLVKLRPESVSVVSWDKAEEVAKFTDLIVNTTSLGMTGKPELEFNISVSQPSCIISDIVYSPIETRLLADARLLGRPVLDGLGMLLHQAVPGFELWFGRTPEVTAELRQIIKRDLLVNG